MSEFHKNPDFQNLPSTKPTTMRALFTVGLLCKHFDFDSKAMGETRVLLKKILDVVNQFNIEAIKPCILKVLDTNHL